MARSRPTGDDLALALASITGHLFTDHARLQRALTHGSAHTANAGVDYQRFEFLGDRVLGLIVADMLFQAFPDAPEGELSVRFNALVNADALAEIAGEIGLPNMVRVGPELKIAGRKQVKLLADAMEALIAALYLDGGMNAARAFIHRYWRHRAEQTISPKRDAKTVLQEWAHRAVQAAPTYQIERREGPDHEPVFTVRVSVPSLSPAIGVGRSKREAEQNAAQALLEREAPDAAGDVGT